MDRVYADLPSRWPGNGWIAELGSLADERLANHPHGDLPRWRAALRDLPGVDHAARLNGASPGLGAHAPDQGALTETLQRLHPWRKGPLQLGGVLIDTEWRSDWKWARIAPHLDLAGKRILDIGCGNGYYGWRMLGMGAELVVGVDPTVLFVMQWLACRHFAGNLPNYVLPLGIEDLPPVSGADDSGFDAVFSMGVLYHRRDPHEHLAQLHSLLSPGGTLVLETLVLPPERDRDVLQPGGRYARMPNVHAVPGVGRLLEWTREAGFSDASAVDVTVTSTDEQRSTSWMRFESLEQALDPENRARTLEGHPAPVRAVVVAAR